MYIYNIFNCSRDRAFQYFPPTFMQAATVTMTMTVTVTLTVCRYDGDHELRLLTRYLLHIRLIPDVQQLGLAVGGVA